MPEVGIVFLISRERYRVASTKWVENRLRGIACQLKGHPSERRADMMHRVQAALVEIDPDVLHQLRDLTAATARKFTVEAWP